MQKFNDLANQNQNHYSLTQNISFLNTDQLRIFNRITNSLQTGKRIRSFMSGIDGTGKSMLIRVLVQWNKAVRGIKKCSLEMYSSSIKRC